MITKTKLQKTTLKDEGVIPMVLYNKLVDLDINQEMNPSFKGGEVIFLNDGSNYSRQVFKEALSRARLLSNS